MVSAQKKPLDHTVYDQWKTIAERAISNDARYVVYTVNPQEGDGELVIQRPADSYRKVVPRGYNLQLTEDSRFLVCKIKPSFQETRQAKIRKKSVAEMPKDSLAIIELGTDSIWKYPAVKSFKLPEKGTDWVAYEVDKLPDTPVIRVKKSKDSLTIKRLNLDMLSILNGQMLKTGPHQQEQQRNHQTPSSLPFAPHKDDFEIAIQGNKMCDRGTATPR